MLIIELNKANYEYDVNSLVRAFYPGETVTILTPESTPLRRQQTTEEQENRQSAGESLLSVCIDMTDGGAEVRFGEMTYVWQYEKFCGEQTEQPCEAQTGLGTDGELCDQSAGRNFDSDYKHEFKRFLYRTLSEYTGKMLPWGSLTGIRPTKIAYGMLDQGRSGQEILDTFEHYYQTSHEKALLGLDIAKREREILKDVDCGQGYSLYIGIPFCPTTCLYCSFTSYPIGGYHKVVDSYIDCLIKEMEFVSKRLAGQVTDSVYIGGGTPTTLEPEQLDRLLAALKKYFDFDRVKEFTVEAGRADSITREKLEVLYRHGVDRISVNPQTMKQETLDVIGRKASVEQVIAAYGLAREVGFTNINMDLILGLPGETEDDVQHTMDRVVELAPDSLTVHSLAIKRASHLSQWIQENGIKTLRNTDATMAIARAGAEMLGMVPYYLYRQKNMSGNFENVGYAKPGKYGLYNILIMEEVQTIVALGAGSISKRVYPDGRIERCDNVKDVTQYIERIDEMIERKKCLLG